jgi:hypothetical protein
LPFGALSISPCGLPLTPILYFPELHEASKLEDRPRDEPYLVRHALLSNISLSCPRAQPGHHD